MSKAESVLPARPTSRWLILDGQGRVLLFHFVFSEGPLAGTAFWATPGGGCEGDETFEDAARRELFEETGLVVEHPGPQVAQVRVSFRLPDGRMADVDQRFFLLRTDDFVLSPKGWTDEEQRVLTQYRWWSLEDIRDSKETIWPAELVEILTSLRLPLIGDR
ncbi:NUDIX domain-containing protein [uncultured Brevundimonas sp.]|uniref:NUDIX hydrolase n=1 Tax=uncultured Brevundimonas sp. TaxID=213418 RepID=UPI0025CE3F31|nr:NUDIX domain-containing protein [uncultured Brevundimonas sp.]